MNRVGRDGRALLAEMRAQAYEVLATLYLQPPSRELVSALVDLAASGTLADLSSGRTAESLRRYALSYTGDLSGLQQEFHDLFTVPLGRYVTPYESVYRDECVIGEERVRGLLMGPSTLAVLQTYRENGFTPSPQGSELPDHVGVELSFMSILCRREHEAREVGDDAMAARLRERERRFLEDHLLRWVPHLRQRITANSLSEFYRGVAGLTEDFLIADRAMVAARHASPADGT
jgi:TorA maturation chaperone TorD